jgi:hypothetical protein
VKDEGASLGLRNLREGYGGLHDAAEGEGWVLDAGESRDFRNDHDGIRRSSLTDCKKTVVWTCQIGRIRIMMEASI